MYRFKCTHPCNFLNIMNGLLQENSVKMNEKIIANT